MLSLTLAALIMASGPAWATVAHLRSSHGIHHGLPKPKAPKLPRRFHAAPELSPDLSCSAPMQGTSISDQSQKGYQSHRCEQVG